MCCVHIYMGFPDGRVVKNPSANAGDTRDMGSVPGSGRSSGEGNGNLLQYSCLENPVDRAWQSTVYGVARVGRDLETKPPPPKSSPFYKILIIETCYLW